jgi:preprotein translocase subunit Sec61beta
MAEEKIRMPMTEAGLVRYGDEAASKIQLKPEYVIALAVAVAVIAIIIRVMYR